MSALDTQVRLLAFAFLEEQQKVYGDALPRSVLERGFDFEGSRVPLIGPQGIFKTCGTRPTAKFYDSADRRRPTSTV
jgi:hypothetical protein